MSGQECKLDRNLGAGADVETMEECCILAGPLLCSAFFLIELKTGTWRQELKQKAWQTAAYQLVPHDLLSYINSLSGMIPSTVSWPALPTSVTDKEKTFPQTSLLGTFPQLKFPLLI